LAGEEGGRERRRFELKRDILMFGDFIKAHLHLVDKNNT
jgi:hypothetical protein